MSGTSKVADRLSDQEMAEVALARAAARARFAHFANDEGEDSGVVDPDNQPMTGEDLARLRPAAEVAPALVAASLRRRGGRPRVAAPKVAVSIRLDPDVLGALRSSGEGWQGRVNDTLRRGLGLSEGRDAAAMVRTGTTRLERDPVRPGADGDAAPDPGPRSRDEPRGIR